MPEHNRTLTPGESFTLGGVSWTIYHTETDRVKCIATECVGNRPFDTQNRNDFASSDLWAWLENGFLRSLIDAGAPEEIFAYFEIDLTTDDGIDDYGSVHARMGLITCDEYRRYRKYIPQKIDECWWTATADSIAYSHYVRNVHTGGSLNNSYAYLGYCGARPVCALKSVLLQTYLNGEKTNVGD